MIFKIKFKNFVVRSMNPIMVAAIILLPTTSVCFNTIDFVYLMCWIM